MLSFAMRQCTICNKYFASGNSLRTHRSRFHRVGKQERSDDDARASTTQTDLDKVVWLPYIRTHAKITDDSLKIKKHGNTSWRFNSYQPSREGQYQDPSVTFISILKNQTQSKASYTFTECYVLKHYVFDKLIPVMFNDEDAMRKNMDEKDYTFALIVRDLPNLVEVHIVLNETESSTNIARITTLFLEKSKLSV